MRLSYNNRLKSISLIQKGVYLPDEEAVCGHPSPLRPGCPAWPSGSVQAYGVSHPDVYPETWVPYPNLIGVLARPLFAKAQKGLHIFFIYFFI